ncbi:hypothetical protein HZS_1365 [Henneguya salminicola]|nr:hypothetical protein HZS_1365 [Henneguya salminicola]
MHDDENEINELLVNASKDFSKYPNQKYQALIRFLNEKHKAIDIPSRNQCSGARNIDGESQRFFMWSSDEGLAVLRTGSELFINATFRVTPHPFVQYLFVMSFDASTNLFVPCVRALMSRINEYLYCELLHSIIFQLKYNSLLNSVKYQFPKSKIIGCYFHMRQTIFQRMKKDGILDDEAQTAFNILI